MSFIDGLKSAAQYTPIGRMVFNGENPLEAVVNATGKQFEGIGNFFADHTPVGRMIVHGEGVITSTYNSGLGNEVAELFDAHDEVQGFCEDVDSALGQIAFGPALPFSFASAVESGYNFLTGLFSSNKVDGDDVSNLNNPVEELDHNNILPENTLFNKDEVDENQNDILKTDNSDVTSTTIETPADVSYEQHVFVK